MLSESKQLTAEVVIQSSLQGLGASLCTSLSRDHDARDEGEAWVGSDSCDELVTVETRHHLVRNDKRRRVTLSVFESSLSIWHFDDRVVLGQQTSDVGAQVTRVLDD